MAQRYNKYEGSEPNNFKDGQPSVNFQQIRQTQNYSNHVTSEAAKKNFDLSNFLTESTIPAYEPPQIRKPNKSSSIPIQPFPKASVTPTYQTIFNKDSSKIDLQEKLFDQQISGTLKAEQNQNTKLGYRNFPNYKSMAPTYNRTQLSQSVNLAKQEHLKNRALQDGVGYNFIKAVSKAYDNGSNVQSM